MSEEVRDKILRIALQNAQDHGRDTETDGVSYSNRGTSEVVMRNQFKAWKAYMQPAVSGAKA